MGSEMCIRDRLDDVWTQVVDVDIKSFFDTIDHELLMQQIEARIRMRLRSILRKRSKRKGRGHGSDHQRWPNAYFTEHGLFSCVAARVEAVSPLKR